MPASVLQRGIIVAGVCSGGTKGTPTLERMHEWRVVAQKAIEVTLELADEWEVA